MSFISLYCSKWHIRRPFVAILCFSFFSKCLFAGVSVEESKVNFDKGLTQVHTKDGELLLVPQKHLVVPIPGEGKPAIEVINGWMIREFQCSTSNKLIPEATYNMGLMTYQAKDAVYVENMLPILRPFMTKFGRIYNAENNSLKFYDSELRLQQFCYALLNAEEVFAKSKVVSK